MMSHVAKGRPKQRHIGRSLSLLLLLPLMCAVIFFASRVGAGNFASGTIERQVTPFETANYAPWNEIVFAAVDDGLLTQVGREESGATVEYAGIATARPTVERRPPVGIPLSIAQYITPITRAETIIENPPASDGVTEVAEAATSEQNNDSTANTGSVNAPTPEEDATDMDTPLPTETAIATNTATATTRATNTATTTASDTATAIPTDTNTPIPSATFTPIPTNTSIPAPNVNFGASPQSGSAPLTVIFTNLSSGNITSYNWNFGDGTSSSAASTSHTYSTAGAYYVQFTVTGPGGSAAAGVTINVSAAQTDTPVAPPQPTDNPDRDGDTVPNNIDQCPDDGDIGYGVLGNGCPAPPDDFDSDGVHDLIDSCPVVGNQGYGVDATGCPNPVPDSDGDGYVDNVDSCPAQGDQGYGVDATGCPNPVPDSDGDGYADNVDSCPAQGNQGYGVDATGCPNPVPDSDGDGYADNVDSCPAQGDQGYGVDATGCPNPVPDSDGDGYADNVDACPAQGDQGYGVDGTGCPNPPPSFSVTGLTVIDTDSQTSLGALGASITLTGDNRGIRAETSGTIGSVVFRIDGFDIQTESAFPYSIAGDGGALAINFWNYTPGTYTLSATPYDAGGGNGNPGVAYTIVITITP